MNKCRTIDKGELFSYQGDLASGLIVQTAEDWEYPHQAKIYISSDEINTIKRKIRNKQEILMGSCRDNPSAGSLGRMLQSKRISPQHLCYVIPLLVKEGFCTTVKEKGAIVIRHYKYK